MKTLGFTAEASLYTSKGPYRTFGTYSRTGRVIHPAQRARRVAPAVDPQCFCECMTMCLSGSVELEPGEPPRPPLDCHMNCTAICWTPWA